MSRIEKIAIANRGEIACRVIRTCKAMGIASVALYSEADHDAEHVRLADEAVFIGPAEATQSYLNIDAVLNAALASGAHAVHPGYGFLSENAEFAERVEAAGLIFIGPKAASMRAMGSKAGAKTLMTTHGVPVVPGYNGDNQDAVHLKRQAETVGYPLMIKAAHGGGGKGMRIVREAADFEAALASCQREARSAFGKDRVLLERYIEKPRHIEFQIFADQHGQTIHLGERECSAQRRFQKVMEESPSPFLNDALRAQMADAAVRAAKAVQYLNAGTVEFIVAQNGEFFFMEINSRLQVEHPVTEMVTGLDLVRWQIEIAEGKPLALSQNAIKHRGHAIEVRLYAEDPERQFMPGSGLIEHWAMPVETPQVRIDTGFRASNKISVYYDPMLAKLIVHADDRTQALHAMQAALAQCHIFGLPSNIGFLERLIAHPVVRNGEIDTGYLDRELQNVLSTRSALPDSHLLAAAYGFFKQSVDLQSTAADPWQCADFWRGHGHGQYRLRLQGPQGEQTVHVHLRGDALGVLVDKKPLQARLLNSATHSFSLEIDQQLWHFQHIAHGAHLVLHDGLHRSGWTSIRAGSGATDRSVRSDGFVRAPMPGKLVLLKVQAGQAVSKGDELAVMEAMKMELSIKALEDGRIGELLAETGRVLDADAPIMQWSAHDV
jgi:3-methylcrotonyl-CoA carboxylase alpha subunit